MALFSSIEEAVDDVDVVVGTSSKLLPAKESPVLDVEQARRLLPPSGERVAFVFGNERDGLTVEESTACHRVVRLNTPGWHDSLNLSHAVGAVLALVTAATSMTTTKLPLSPRSRERLIDEWNARLDARGYFRSTTASEFRPRLARLVDQMNLDDRDAALLQGMLRTLAPSSSDSSSDSSSEPS